MHHSTHNNNIEIYYFLFFCSFVFSSFLFFLGKLLSTDSTNILYKLLTVLFGKRANAWINIKCTYFMCKAPGQTNEKKNTTKRTHKQKKKNKLMKHEKWKKNRRKKQRKYNDENGKAHTFENSASHYCCCCCWYLFFSLSEYIYILFASTFCLSALSFRWNSLSLLYTWWWFFSFLIWSPIQTFTNECNILHSYTIYCFMPSALHNRNEFTFVVKNRKYIEWAILTIFYSFLYDSIEYRTMLTDFNYK